MLQEMAVQVSNEMVKHSLAVKNIPNLHHQLLLSIREVQIVNFSIIINSLYITSHVIHSTELHRNTQVTCSSVNDPVKWIHNWQFKFNYL